MTIEIARIENKETREQTARQISNTLDSMIRFSNEWFAYIKQVESWTKLNGALYAVYSED